MFTSDKFKQKTFTYQFMKAKPASSSASSDGSFTVTHTGSNNKKNPPGGAGEYATGWCSVLLSFPTFGFS